MTEPKLNPQEPGASVADDKLAAILAMPVGDLVEQFDSLTVDELEQLANLERQGKDRSTALGAIQRELAQRDVTASDPAEGEVIEKSKLGDDRSYASMRAHEIDPSKLASPVLTLDGWLLPTPRAEG